MAAGTGPSLIHMIELVEHVVAKVMHATTISLNRRESALVVLVAQPPGSSGKIFHLRCNQYKPKRIRTRSTVWKHIWTPTVDMENSQNAAVLDEEL